MALSEDGRRRLSEAAKKKKPWLHSTGPRTPEGKRRSAANSLKGPLRRNWLANCQEPKIHDDPVILRAILCGVIVDAQGLNLAALEGDHRRARPGRAKRLVDRGEKFARRLLELEPDNKLAAGVIRTADKFYGRENHDDDNAGT